MAERVPSLAEWCVLPVDADSAGERGDLFMRINGSWHTEADRPESLLKALALEADTRCRVLIDRSLAAGTDPTIATLHRIFVAGFDECAELASCRKDLDVIGRLGTRKDLLRHLARTTRDGYATPLYLQVRTAADGTPVVTPVLYPAPLPPEDYADPDRMTSYAAHLRAVLAVLGVDLCEDRLQAVIELERDLWAPAATGGERRPFPWDSFLLDLVGPRARPWRTAVAPALIDRMAAWWRHDLIVLRDWLAWRYAYDFIPFVTEAAFEMNSKFFAGRVLGLTQPRRRPERFVSLVKTVAPGNLARLYVEDCQDEVVLRRAHGIVEDVRRAALNWARRLDPAVGADLQRAIDGLTVELGEQSGERAQTRCPELPTVCAAIKHARQSYISTALERIDRPARDTDWRIAPFTAAAYYQRSSNSVIVPWGLLQEPLLPRDGCPAQAYAMFGSLVAHEMAHAVVPERSAAWPAFVRLTGLTGVLEHYDAATGNDGSTRSMDAPARELAADTLGLAWATEAFAASLDGCDDAQRNTQIRLFFAYWATRWRGSQGVDRDGARHFERHPPARVRCNIPLDYACEYSLAAGLVGTH